MAEVEAKEDADSAGDDDDDGDDDGETCAVCHTGHSGPGNFIVICEGKCELSFHQKCYGIADIPPGDEPWYCDWCAGGNKTHFGKQLYCCHYKSDKATRFLNVVGKEGEQHYVHIQCAAWNPDIDTSHLPFTTTLRKVKASWSKCILCSGRFGYQLHCAHVENGNPCQAAFHPMCAFRHGFLPPPSDYQAKYEICYCPDHAADSEVTASAKDGADPSAEDDHVATSNEDQLARRRTLPSYFSTGARPNSDAQRENVRLSTAQEWPTKRRYRTSRLDSREPPPSKPPASAVGVVGHLPPSLDDDVSDATRSAVSLSGTAATSTTPDRRNRGRPRRRQSSMDVDSNSEAATSRKTSVSISIPTSSVIEGEESVTGSDRVDAPPTRSSSHRRSLTRDANSDAQGNSTLRSGAPSIEKGSQKSPVTPKLKLSLSRAAEAAGPSNKQPGASEAANDFVAKGAQPASAGAATVPLPVVVGSVAAQLPSAGTPSAQSASLLNSSGDQISPYAAFAKRPNIRIKPFSQASSMSPTSGVSPGTHPYSAGNRGYTSLLAPAGLHARPSPAAALSDDQATMLKESHFMLQKYGDMLGDMSNMIRGISIMPAPRTYEPMNVASSMSAPVSNGMGPPVAFRSPPMMLPQQIPPYHPYARPPPPPAQAQFRMPVAGTFSVRPMPPSFPSAHTIHLPQTTAPFRPPYVPNTSAPQQGQLPHHSTPPVAELPPPPFPQASSDHTFTATMPSLGPQDIAPWAGSPASGNSRVKRKRATPPSDHYSNGSDSSWPACSRQRQTASPAPYVYSPMGSPASLADPSRRVYPQGTSNMLKEPAGAISASVRRPYTRSTCIQAGSTLLNYANPLVDMEIEMEELKDNIIYLIQGINMPQALLDTMMPSASPDAASDASTNPENQDRIVALGLLTEELQKIGKLTKFNVADYVGVLVDAMQAVKRSKK
ncbi:hypothetical protein GGI10_002305 [Coemansia sp. RSA 2530]|nr:hypothetical protein GGI10_002305 [Coemansia sp. RSA 2530]